MRVAIVAPSVFPCPPVDYGGDISVYDLCKGLTEIGFNDYTLISPIGSNSPSGKLITTIEPPYKWGTNEEERAYEVYKDYLDNFDIIDNHDHSGQVLQKYKGEAKIIHTFHGLSIWDKIPRTDVYYITLSQYHREQTKQKLGIDSDVIGHGIDTSYYIPSKSKEDFYLCISLMTPHKGHDIAIRACKQAGVRLVVCGEDRFVPDISYVNNIITLCAIEGYEYLGRITRQEKLSLLQRAKAMILPFRSGEAYSLIALEAQACGAPIISSTLGAMTELVIDGVTGILCSKEGEYIDAIKKIETITPDECRRWAERFDRKEYAKKYLEVYEKWNQKLIQ